MRRRREQTCLEEDFLDACFWESCFEYVSSVDLKSVKSNALAGLIFAGLGFGEHLFEHVSSVDGKSLESNAVAGLIIADLGFGELFLMMFLMLT